MRLALLVAYDGTGFRGFARQPSHRTVQGELDQALGDALRAPVRTTGAGRTDRGVHAWGQVVSFEAPDGTDPAWVQYRVNRRVAPEISVRAAAAVPDGFDARFSAHSRTYEYRFYRSEAPDPFLDRYAWHVPGAFDLRGARAGARALLGEHDFSSFCRADGRPLVRRVRRVAFSTPEPGRLTMTIVADSFCQQMVRSIVGTLVEVARRERAPEDVARVLRARDRAAAAPVAPPHGLHLVAVGYRPDPFA